MLHIMVPYLCVVWQFGNCGKMFSSIRCFLNFQTSQINTPSTTCAPHSISSSSFSISGPLLQLVPWQVAHIKVQCKPDFRQEHWEKHPFLQLHEMSCKSSSEAGGSSVKTGSKVSPTYSSPISLEEGDCQAILEPVQSMYQGFSIMHKKNKK